MDDAGEGEDDHRMTARQLALLKAAGGQKRKPIMDVDTSSSDEEGSESGKGGRRRKAGKKRQRGDRKGKGKGDKNGGGRDKMEVSDDDEDDVVEVCHADALKALKQMTMRLEAQLKQAKQAEKQAREVYELRMAAPDAESLEHQHRISEVDRQIRVWSSMVCADVDTQISHVDKVATRQMKENIRKLDAIRHKLNETDEDDAEQAKSHLEGLPEALWMADGVGMGAMMGFVSCLESLASVNTFFRHLTQSSGMHPIVELDDSPKMKIAKKWAAGPLSECADVRICHRPTKSLVYLLERLSVTVESVDLQCPYEHPIYRNGKHAPERQVQYNVERDMRQRKGDFQKVDLPQNKKPIVFERVESASVGTVWMMVAEDRMYQMPHLQGLSVVDITIAGAHRWIREADGGIKSLHIICDKEDPKCRGAAASLSEVANALADTPSAKSLTSLTGRIEFSNDPIGGFINVVGVAEDEGGPLGFIGNIVGNLVGTKRDKAGPLEEIEMAIGEIHSTQKIQHLHDFRTKCLAPDACENYFGRIEEGELQGGPTVHLPFFGNKKALTDSFSTVEVCCRQAEKVTLDSRPCADTIKEAPGLDSLVCEHSHELTIIRAGGTQQLPSYITDDPTSLFPSVSSVMVSQGREGRGVYDGGAGDVLHALSPHLEKVRFELSARANPEATCTLLPDGLGFVSDEGRELAVQLTYDFERVTFDAEGNWVYWENVSVEWKLCRETEAVRQVMESGRVSSLDVEIRHHFNTTESRKFYASFAECVVVAFSAFPALNSVVLSVRYKPGHLVSMLRQGAKKRCRVTERADGTIVLRPSQARQRAKKKEGEGEEDREGEGEDETDTVIKKEEE
ncbi:unnamed protein product [Vitrella brassicaformis CCMP3155]|uniref:Uncharacterized protein n=1 Tax=Vitrella brassicaformis (strain CCMP3155) TaxID=1169540 RepID=A0A0G4GAX3_VITBC|nr:unnamed protein product [Vitrella brassicaformis CCMP3155]|eukprot:CEM26280.1 unnamed protein product [Vitrella brassicaformis CCMP3155]